MQLSLQPEEIQKKIYFVRDQKIMLDIDLAILFDVSNKVLNQKARRNPLRFPEDFRFQLTKSEYTDLKSQFPYLKKGRFLPYCFTEHGVSMLASILNTDRAIEIHLLIIRAFVHLRNSSNHDINFDPHEGFLKNELPKITETLKLILNRIERIGPPTPPRVPSIQLERSKSPHQTSAEKIQTIVAQYFGFSVKSLLKATREPRIVHARAISMFLMRRRLNFSFKEVGAQFGGKDHTTVLHACRKIEEKLEVDQNLLKMIEDIEKHLNQAIETGN